MEAGSDGVDAVTVRFVVPMILTARRLCAAALILLPTFVSAAQGKSGAFEAFDDLAPMDTLQRRLGGPAGFGARDFDLLVNYRAVPPRAPSVVESLLRDPRGVDSIVPRLRRDLNRRHDAADGMVRAEPLWRWLDIDNALPVAPSASSVPTVAVAPAILAKTATASLKDYVTTLSPAQISFLLRETPGMFLHRVEDTLLNPIEREIERVRGGAVIDSVMRLAESLPMGKLAEAARDLDALLLALMRSVREDGVPATLKLLRALERAGVPVTVGGKGSDTHLLERGIVFDPGGDDRYRFPLSPRPGSWLLVLDVSGEDAYVGHGAADSAAGAAAFFSVRLLADLAGHDHYDGDDFAFGSAVMGFSRLLDAAGDDVYRGRCASLAFAFHGIGILQDREGNDAYSSAYLSQAASSSFGIALLLDDAGDDRYVSRTEFVDDLRYRDRFLSLSQGFSTGSAPRHGGGIAVLHDRAGDDAYSADIFGQGAGYWFAWGLLMDDAGDDSFHAHQYAQGAGVHFAAGTLLDGGGDDVRVSKGVSQGCGHDGAFGLLADAAGRDSTRVVDMSAGAGSANGLGVFIDFEGDDTHAAGNPAMSLGHGDIRRDRGSLGFFLDLGGRDEYTAPRHDEATWRAYNGTSRGEGHGLDAE